MFKWMSITLGMVSILRGAFAKSEDAQATFWVGGIIMFGLAYILTIIDRKSKQQ